MGDYVQVVAALRVDLAVAGCPGHSVLVVPKPAGAGPDFREFYRVSRDTVEAVYMFGRSVSSDEEAVGLAISNGPEYIW